MATKLPIYDERMLQFMKYCIEEGMAPNRKSFFTALEMHDSAYFQIIEGRQSFTLKQIQIVAEHFNLDINWLFGLSETMLRKDNSSSAIENLKAAVKVIEVEFKRKNKQVVR